jgi:outer membrane receptor protein involved in Fe transport
MKRLITALGALGILFVDGSAVLAQQADPGNSHSPSTAGTPAPSGDSNRTLSTVTVSGTNPASVVPTDTQVSSVFGNDMSIADTPRAVTEVNSNLLKDANIQDLSDLAKVAPSAYTTDQFGVASVPVIRGQAAEVYINGQQRTTRGDGPPTNFNAYQSVDIVPGPASSVFGPTAYVGGYVNLVTKQPYFDRFHSETDFTYGSYDEKKWTEDFGGPINDKLAYRISYYGNYSGSYYNNEKTQENDIFAALTWIPNDQFRVDFNADFYDGRFNENTGWNRPTQALIDNNQYSTGSVSHDAFGFPASPSGTFAGLITSPGTVKLSPSTGLVSPRDSDFGKDLNAQLTATYVVNDNVTLINRMYYEYFELRNTEYAQLYVNLQNSHIFQDRFEVHIDFDTPIGGGVSGGEPDAKATRAIHEEEQLVFKNSIIVGAAVKYVNVLGFGDFFNEYLNATDLSSGVFPTINNQSGPGNLSAVFPVRGTNFSASPGTFQPNTTGESATELSAFLQYQITFSPQWTLLAGGRLDTIFDELYNPIPQPGVANKNLNSTQFLGSGNISLTYKPQPWVTSYATFSYSQSTPGNSGGGFETYSSGAPSSDYHFNNFLYEGGLKFDLLDHTLFAAVDGYYQSHSITTTLGATTEVRTLGAELSATYQPNKNFYVTLNASYLDATVVNPSSQFTDNVYNAFDPASVGVQGLGGGSPNFKTPPPGHYRESGLPRFLLSGLATYKLDCGLGFSLGYLVTDPIPTSELGNVKIPWQYELDASVFYTRGNYTAKVTFYNITDQENFSTGGYINGTGNDLITPHLPFHVEATISYKF